MAYAFGAAVDVIIKDAICDASRRAVVCWAPAHNHREAVAGIVIGTTIAGAGIAVILVTGVGHPLATLSWPEVFTVIALIVAAFLLTALGWRRRAVLTALRPRDSWLVSSVSSVVPGAGGDVLSALCNRADQLGRHLCLDAAVGPLTEQYYPRFGFQPKAEPVDLGRGRRRQVMVRDSRQPSTRS